MLIRKIAIHVAMVSLFLCAGSLLNYFVFNGLLGKGVYGATLVTSVYLQIILGMNMLRLYKADKSMTFYQVQDINIANMSLIVFITISIVVLSITLTSKFLIMLAFLAYYAFSSNFISKNYEIESPKG